MTPFWGIIELTYNTKLSKRRVSLLNPIISFLFLYNQYLLKQIDQLLLELFNETNIYNRPLSLRCPYCAVNFKYKKFNAHIMGLCLTYHVNLKLSTRQTAHALDEVHGIKISHTMVANKALCLDCHGCL